MHSKLSNLANDGKIYGIPISELTYNQGKRVFEFSTKTQPWLEENIGKFGEEWFVEIDKEYDSLRLQFKDGETAAYFKLAWMQRDHNTI